VKSISVSPPFWIAIVKRKPVTGSASDGIVMPSSGLNATRRPLRGRPLTMPPSERHRPAPLGGVVLDHIATRADTVDAAVEERLSLLAVEIADLARQAARGRQARFELPCALTKGDRGRSVLLPQRLLHQIVSYIAAERAHAVAKFKNREEI
jgi:hypothetical protein